MENKYKFKLYQNVIVYIKDNIGIEGKIIKRHSKEVIRYYDIYTSERTYFYIRDLWIKENKIMDRKEKLKDIING